MWGVLAGLSALAIMPYVLQLMPEMFEKLQIPLPVFVLIQVVQATVLLGLLSLAGLRMGHRVGLGSPLMQAWLGSTAAPDGRTLKPFQAIGLGVLAAMMIIGGSLVVDPLLPEPLYAIEDPGAGLTALNGLLASFYGGIAEELMLRLFLMTAIVWLLCAFSRREPRPAIFWLAIVLSALLFGAGHLPAAAEVWGLDAIVVFRTIALNAIAAVVFGWLYWRRGIEMAMLGHFSADIVLHVLAPLAQWG
ncbi:MAG: CPBP family intramembrane metalloprotease [Lysobacter sp.]|nr:CPBP family intramembrane metalloprotease [Lysobacter sp.]